jgi:Tol biopolymer transport system component
MNHWIRPCLMLVLLASVQACAEDVWLLPPQAPQLLMLRPVAPEISAVTAPSITDILYSSSPVALMRTADQVSLIRIDPADSEPTTLFCSPDLDPLSLAVSWDGFHTVLSMKRDGHYKLHLLVGSGPEAISLTDGAGDDRFPALSPDKTFIAFRSNRDGRWKLYGFRLRATPSLESSPLPLTLWETHLGVEVGPSRALLPGPSEERAASFGPRGLAFLSSVSGTWDLWVLEGTDHTSLRRIVANVDEDSPVSWVGERIFVVRGGVPALISADGRFFQPVEIPEESWWLLPGAPHFLVKDDGLWRVEFSEPPAPQIAFFREGTERDDETAELWLGTLDGRAWKAAEQVCLGEAVWSPDGENLAYLRRLHRVAPLPSPEGGYLPDWYELWVANADGTEPRLIRVFTPYDPPWIPAEIQWGPAGERLYFSVAGSPTHREIWYVRPDGSGLSSLTWGWDFQVHSMESIGGITRGFIPFAFDPRTGDKHFFEGLGQITQIEFSPSHQLAVGQRGGELLLMDLPDGTARILPVSLRRAPWTASRFSVSWAPDETAFVFTAPANGDDEVFLYDLETSQIVQITDNDVDDSSPAWSPDGKHIAYLTAESASPSLCMIRLADGAARGLFTGRIVPDAIVWSHVLPSNRP